jgi:Zn-finger nucleic acid-binding protein
MNGALRQEVMEVVQASCPWCEVELPASYADAANEQTCPECRTTWLYEDEPVELALAA